MSYQPRIVAFAGSTRENSYNKRLVTIAANSARESGADVKLIDLRDFPMPLFDEDLETKEGKNEAARDFKQLLIDSDGILISSPEYNGSLSAVLKNAIDWATRADAGEAPGSLPAFRGKVVSLMSASPGGLGGLRGLVHLRAILGGLGCIMLPAQLAVSSAHDAFDETGNLKNEKQQQQILTQGQELSKFIAQLNKLDS
ncbi:NADPH-dependent FMN reductase [Gimesia aquarii]|uniref:FMN-dependent NADPH-azoreductase n=1 Tax=Gimesia aquarii TaxID=2527964 RepID=A0A517W478_9PLAN|nr:NAD(P)H-dependent oxidoreductase [Gimesia aquarii]QDU00056.1 FMN-dependent NADPH-azoreductase [Gimesia aquarii]